MHALLLATLAAAASAMPSYIAVPADQIAFVDLSALRVRRVPRQTLTPPPLPNLYSQDFQPVPILPYQNQYQPNQNQYQQNQNQYQPNQNLYQAIQQEPVALSQPQEAQGPERLLRLQQPRESASLASSQQLAERPPDFGEFVDFGAHTGDNGAFGWYADYPINNHDDHSSYRK